ncbi:peptidoglycan DD-metalloendopeptidase family protein [Sporosarcina sp. G11-34]|nr:peptidoglycan DD-metalloendopeptidase family protein [Sporosarcina sp. G11-34]
MEQKRNVYENKKVELNNGINNKVTELNTNESKVDEISGQIQALDTKFKETNDKISQVEDEISETTKEVEELHSSIAELEKRIEERDIVLRDRVRALQVNGGSVNYIDVLLGASSFSDFIDRYSAVSTLLDADKKIMEEQKADKDQLEVEKKLVETKLKEQEERKDELSSLKASLDSQKKEKAKLVDALKVEQKKLASEKANLEGELDEVYEISRAVELEIAAEQQRQIEAARKLAEEQERKEAAAKAAAEKQAAQAAKAAQASKPATQSKAPVTAAKPSSGGQSTQASKPAPPAPSMSGGNWTRPASGRFSSSFGYRTHPIHGGQRLHAGVDIANSVGTGIYAAGSGVVFRAGWHSSYGNHIMITHSINGKTYTTVYAHMTSLNVSVGQAVSKGQAIGTMGSTGASTGSHLHFELHNGTYSSSSAINPVGIVPL